MNNAPPTLTGEQSSLPDRYSTALKSAIKRIPIVCALRWLLSYHTVRMLIKQGGLSDA